jgi:VWFA-related protein
MSRLPIAVLTVAVCLAAFVGAAQEPTFHAGTHGVAIYATVVDGSGRPVTSLEKNDFEVFDNGVRQNVTVFDPGIQPITVVLMLDRSGSMSRNFGRVRDAAERFLFTLLPADRARVGSFSERITIDPADFTSDRTELVRILHENLQAAGATPLWDATAAAMTALAHESGRRVVLLFTDGVDSPTLAETHATLRDVIRRAQIEETMVYAVGLADPCGPTPVVSSPASAPLAFQGRGRGPARIGRGRVGGGLGPGRMGPRPGDGRIGGRPGGLGRAGGDPGKPCTLLKPDPGLRELADEGGGAYFELRGTDDLTSTFARVANELHHQYLIGFTAGTLDGELHRLDVRVRPSNLTVRARRTYLAEKAK